MSESNDLLHINADSGATNTIHGVDFYNSMIATCDLIFSILDDHCGPHATDALLIQDNAASSLKDRYYAIFTRDGITIVKSIKFSRPIQTQIQELVAYIGSRVESLSHDGTTSAMMFFTALASKYFNLIRQALYDETSQHYRLVEDLKRTLSELCTALEERAMLTIEKYAELANTTEQEAVRRIAFSQSMLSSKGDKELTAAIVEFVETLPKEFYQLLTVSQSGVETEKRFTVLRDEFDFEVPVIANIDEMNHRMGTEYFAESADLLLCEDDLIQGNPVLEIVETHIQAADNGLLEQDLIIIAKTIDSRLVDRIHQINQRSSKKIIAWPVSLYNQYSSKVTTLSAIMAMASVYPLHEVLINNELPYLIRNVKVHYTATRRVTISNLYPKDGSVYHPSFTDPDRFPPYTTMVTEIRNEITDITSGRKRVQSATDESRFKDYVQIYRRMISSDVRNLQLSGMRHETLADADLVRDSLGAVLSSLDKGFVYDGYLKMFLLLNTDQRFTNNPAAVHISDVIYAILKRVHKKDVLTQPKISRVPVTDDDGNSVTIFPTEEQETRYAGEFFTLFDARLDLALRKDAGEIQVYLCYPVDADPTAEPVGTTKVIQPADTFREMFLRFGDLMPRLLKTSRAIIPGTVNKG